MASRVLDKKLKKVLEMRTDTPALLESLEAISALISYHGGSKRTTSSATVGGVGGWSEAAGGGGGGPGAPGDQEYSTIEARRSLREDLERQVNAVTIHERGGNWSPATRPLYELY